MESQENIIRQTAGILGKYDMLTDHGTGRAEKGKGLKSATLSDTCYLTLGVSPNKASNILRLADWNQDKIYDDYIGSSQLSSIIINGGPRIMSASQLYQQPFTCQICYDGDPDTTTVSAGCNHRFCMECYQCYLSQKITDEGTSRPIKCPEHGCDAYLDDSTLECVADEVVLSRYKMLQIQAFVNNHDHFRWCPAPDCDYVVECHVLPRSLVYIVPTVQCACTHVFCFGCGLPDHRPATCGIVKKWTSTSVGTSETLQWILKNTRECPYCRVDIEKNGGCDHMTCGNCRRSFCWSCLGKKDAADREDVDINE
jgi:ariadne-1